LQALGIADPVDVIVGSLSGTLLAIRHPVRVRRLMMCAVAPDMAGPTRDYLVERAAKCPSGDFASHLSRLLAGEKPA
jgi:pimeloyl-ACP methyl ester carboxylesterase